MPATFCELLPETKSEKSGAITWEPAADGAPWVAGVLTIAGKRTWCRYRVEESSSGSAARAFSLFKLSDGSDAAATVYHCTLTAGGRALECSCRGFEATGFCKHASALQCLAANGQL